MAVVKEEEEIVQEEVSLGALNLARLVDVQFLPCNVDGMDVVQE